MAIFKKEAAGTELEKHSRGAKPRKKATIPAGLWTKCPSCEHVVYNKALKESYSVCPKCAYHFVITARERIEQFLDKDSFVEHDGNLASADPLSFTGVKSYPDKLKEDQARTQLLEACLTGEGTVKGARIAFGVTDSRFIMGSMGSVVGEKIARLVEFAIAEGLPLVIISGSGGGARMYEGAISLMQMAKTSMALQKFNKEGLLYISILTNPTMGGVMASFAALGDIIIAEPKALIGFAGPRVIEQTIRQKLPNDFQTSEFLRDRGMVDMVVGRKELQNTVATLLEYFG